MTSDTTSALADRQANVEQLMKAVSPDQQLALREPLRGEPDYFSVIASVYMANPFFRLTAEEIRFFSESLSPPAMRDLMLARHAASRSGSPKYVVFCMPKSGSSFVQSALQRALELPFVSLTGFGTAALSSYFGMNSREQEIDELALVKSIIARPAGFVAQHHTRCSMFLGLQMHFYGVRPILTVRNIPDCIVSYDDMMLDWRAGKGDDGWILDPQFTLPLDYAEREEARRYEILARSFGAWLIAFYVSWKRCIRRRLISPLILRYEEDVLDHDRFTERLGTGLDMTDEQRARLAAYARDPDKQQSRFNVGRRGRGQERLPEPVMTFLEEQARVFEGELDAAEVRYLVR